MDVQASPELAQKLSLLGFDVLDLRSVPELQWERDDVKLLKWARKHRRVLLGLDLYRQSTGVAMNEEIRLRKGRVLTVAGGPQQSVHRVLGKLLFYQDQWKQFFREGHGRVEIASIGSSPSDHAARIRMHRPGELPSMKTSAVTQGQAYLEKRALRRKLPPAKKPRAKVPPLDQASLDERPIGEMR